MPAGELPGLLSPGEAVRGPPRGPPRGPAEIPWAPVGSATALLPGVPLLASGRCPGGVSFHERCHHNWSVDPKSWVL